MKQSKIFAFVTAAGISCFMLLSANQQALTTTPQNSSVSQVKNTCKESNQKADKQLAKVLPEKILQLLQ